MALRFESNVTPAGPQTHPPPHQINFQHQAINETLEKTKLINEGISMELLMSEVQFNT